VLRSQLSLTGFAAAMMTVLVTAGWQITTRYGVTTDLSPIDLALLRYGLPGLILLPMLARISPFPPGVGRGSLLLIVAGSGLPFGLLAILAASHAPVAHMGILLPGGIMAFVALLTVWISGQKLPFPLFVGTILIGGGIAILAAGTVATMSTKTFAGDALFLLAAFMWAGYTLALRGSGLTAWHATGISAFWSLVMILPLWLLFHEGRLFAASITDLGLQILVQSVLAGVVAVWSYSVAIRELGPMRTAAIGGLIPVLSGSGGALFLHEPLGILQAVSAILVLCGVLISTGILPAKVPKLPRRVSP